MLYIPRLSRGPTPPLPPARAHCARLFPLPCCLSLPPPPFFRQNKRTLQKTEEEEGAGECPKRRILLSRRPYLLLLGEKLAFLRGFSPLFIPLLSRLSVFSAVPFFACVSAERKKTFLLVVCLPPVTPDAVFLGLGHWTGRGVTLGHSGLDSHTDGLFLPGGLLFAGDNVMGSQKKFRHRVEKENGSPIDFPFFFFFGFFHRSHTKNRCS